MLLSDKSRKTAIAEALSFLQEQGYDYVGCSSETELSSILSLKTPFEKYLISGEVIPANYVDSGTIAQWWDLPYHRNVVPLFNIIGVKDLYVLFMPLYETSLQNICNNMAFRTRVKSFQLTKTWIRDVAEGLSHFHRNELCHMSLQPSNIYIGQDVVASVGNFDFIQSTTTWRTAPPVDLPLPRQHSPPECWTCESEGGFGGIPYDMWSLGIMALKVWTGFTLETKHSEDWQANIYPRLLEALQFECFKRRVTEAYPNSVINDAEIKVCLNFLRGLLHRDPLKRPDTSRVLKHPVLPGGDWKSWFTIDPMWGSRRYQDLQGGNVRRNEDTVQVSTVGVSSEAAGQQTHVQGWLWMKWRRVKAFFCCQTISG